MFSLNYMKKVKAHILAIGLLFIGSLTVFGQHKYTVEADLAYESEQYAVAAELYKKASSKEDNREIKREITFRMGECYRMMRDWRRAEGYYNRAIRSRYEDPIAELYMADMLKAQGEFEEAMEAYNSYREKAPSDSRGTLGVESCKKALEWMENPTRYDVTNIKEFNTKFDEMGLTWANYKDYNALLFTSSREEAAGKGVDGWTGQSFYDIFYTEQERTRSRSRRGAASDAEPSWASPVPVNEEINTNLSEGAMVVNARGNVMYFTRCGRERNKDVPCQLYMCRKQGRSWGTPELVEFEGLDSLASIGQPTFVDDDGEVMIFAGKIDNGYGGSDLWMSTYNRRGRKWSKPTNLGSSVNTESNEYFPVVHRDGYLYFSSEGHVNMGGLDVFRAKINEDGTFGEAENMGYPINSIEDDFGLVFKENDVVHGYLSSSREGGRGGVDLYKVYLKPLLYTLGGVVTDAKNGRVIPGVTVKLMGTDGTAVEARTDGDGAYFFDVANFSEEMNYTLNFEKDDYLTKSGNVTTVGVPMSSFEPTTDGFLYAMTHNKALDPVRKPIVLPKIEYDFNSAELRDEGKISLDGLVNVLEDNPNIVIELRSHTDHIGSTQDNLSLSQRRAESCVSYLIEKGIDADRLVAVGMGESDPFVIPESFTGPDYVKSGDRLTESFIRRLERTNGKEADEFLRQLNRRTDFQVLRKDFVPKNNPDTDK